MAKARPIMHLTTLRDAASVIEVLGGTVQTAKMVGRWHSQVSQWKARGEFPPEYFLLMTTKLRELGYTASPTLWRQAVTV